MKNRNNLLCRNVRVSLKLTRQDFAFFFGIKKRTVENWENYRPLPKNVIPVLRMIQANKDVNFRTLRGIAYERGSVVDRNNLLCRDVRALLKLTRQEFAFLFDVKVRTVENWENYRLLPQNVIPRLRMIQENREVNLPVLLDLVYERETLVVQDLIIIGRILNKLYPENSDFKNRLNEKFSKRFTRRRRSPSGNL